MTKLIASCCVMVAFQVWATAVLAQDLPQQPLYLVHADSVVGTGGLTGGIREFLGNVSFRQGNVFVSCDRAVQYLDANRADLFGKVVVRQESMTIRAPKMVYDGNALVATADKGLVLDDSGRTVAARWGTYSTATHVASFRDSVRVRDDSLRIAADTLVYERDIRRSVATGNVLVADSAGTSILTGQHGVHDARSGDIEMAGQAHSWSTSDDTSYVEADTIRGNRNSASYQAHGHAYFVRGGVAARAEHLLFDEFLGMIFLRDKPIVWSDSLQLTGDTVDIFAPGRKLRTIVARNNAMLVSRTDTVRTDRYDQVAGRVVTMYVEQDTMRKLTAVDDARSITWRVEEEEPQGLATFASDTIHVVFEAGTPVDIYWLGGVEGEHHPENIVAGRGTASYMLPGFVWREDRPVRKEIPILPLFVKP